MTDFTHIFRTEDVDPYAGFVPIPQGNYTMMITESSLKDTKNGAGQYIELVLHVLEGEFKGTVLWDRLNIANNSERAAMIARQRLVSVGIAIGKRNFNDTEDLHDKPFIAHVKIIEDPHYGKKNEIAYYKALAGNVTAPVTVAPKPAGAAITSNKVPTTLPSTPRTRAKNSAEPPAPWLSGKPSKNKPIEATEEPKDEITF